MKDSKILITCRFNKYKNSRNVSTSTGFQENVKSLLLKYISKRHIQ